MYKYTSGEIPTDSLSTYFARAIVTHSLIDLLKLALVARLFIESDKVFQRMAHLMDNESFPYDNVSVLGNCRRFFVLRL